MSFGHHVEAAKRTFPRHANPHRSFAKRLADALGQGEFIPSKPGTLGLGYELWARHKNGDVILHCGGNAGWFDWFTPVQAGDDPDFTLPIEGRPYRLVRGVDVVPAAFEVISADRASRYPAARRPGRPTVRQERPYRVEQLEDGQWSAFGDHATLALAVQDGDRYLRLGFRVVYQGEVVYAWQPETQGATA